MIINNQSYYRYLYNLPWMRFFDLLEQNLTNAVHSLLECTAVLNWMDVANIVTVLDNSRLSQLSETCI